MRKHAFRIAILPSLLAALSGGSASAGVLLGAGVEQYDWRENVAGSQVVHIHGPRYFLTAAYDQDKASGLAFRGAGTLYAGRPTYDGQFIGGGALSSDIDYAGGTLEGLALWKTRAGAFDLAGLAGLGWDAWRRRITFNGQTEDWSVWYLKAGAELAKPGATGWRAGAGLTYTISTSENAHLDSLGFDSNPRLHPGKDWGAYLEVGYRFSPSWEIDGYWRYRRFPESDHVTVNLGGVPVDAFQPESKEETLGVGVVYRF